MDEKRYKNYFRNREKKFESVCVRCGKCCGALDDPCRNLIKTADGTYFCKDYENRLGPQRTVSGKVFNCVSIREHIAKGTLRPDCAYNIHSRSVISSGL